MPSPADLIRLAVLLVVLAACASAPPPPKPAPKVEDPVYSRADPPVPRVYLPPPPPDPMAGASRRLLAWHERLQAMTPEQVAGEVLRMTPASEDPLSTLELAMALAHTRNQGDLQRAITLLHPIAEPAAGEGIGEPMRAWARLLFSNYVERRKAEDAAEKQAQAMKEQQRRIDQLNGKLEALRAIERSLGAPKPDGK